MWFFFFLTSNCASHLLSALLKIVLILFKLLSVCSEESSLGIDHAEEMELLLDNYYLQVEYSLIN